MLLVVDAACRGQYAGFPGILHPIDVQEEALFSGGDLARLAYRQFGVEQVNQTALDSHRFVAYALIEYGD